MEHHGFCLFLLDTLLFVVFTHGRQRFARFEGTSVHFNGLSLDESDISEIDCAIRYEVISLHDIVTETMLGGKIVYKTLSLYNVFVSLFNLVTL